MHFICVKMPILEIRNEYTLRFTYKCNWNCSYCAINNLKEKDLIITHENILNCIKQIPDNSNVTISGGEPGLLEKNKIQLYLDLLKQKNCILFLETNGLFLIKYPEFENYFEKILYHCSSELELPKINLNNLDKSKYNFLLIIHNNNIKFLKSFLDNFPAIKFDLIEATYPYEITGPVLSKQNKNILITQFSKSITKDSLKRLLIGKNFDNIKYLN